MRKQPEKYRTGRIAALTAAATLAVLALTYEVQGCSVDESKGEDANRAAKITSSYDFADWPEEDNADYIYEEGAPIDQALVDINGKCDLFTENVDALVALRNYIAPEGIVYPDVEYRVPILQCAQV